MGFRIRLAGGEGTGGREGGGMDGSTFLYFKAAAGGTCFFVFFLAGGRGDMVR